MPLPLLEPLSLGDLTEQEACWTLWYLATLFQVEPPALRWTMQAIRPRYDAERALIAIGPSCQPDVERGRLHAFAPYLSWRRLWQACRATPQAEQARQHAGAVQGPQRGTYTGTLKGAHRSIPTDAGTSPDAPTAAAEEQVRCP
jgi:hypothetical protein